MEQEPEPEVVVPPSQPGTTYAGSGAFSLPLWAMIAIGAVGGVAVVAAGMAVVLLLCKPRVTQTDSKASMVDVTPHVRGGVHSGGGGAKKRTSPSVSPSSSWTDNAPAPAPVLATRSFGGGSDRGDAHQSGAHRDDVGGLDPRLFSGSNPMHKHSHMSDGGNHAPGGSFQAISPHQNAHHPQVTGNFFADARSGALDAHGSGKDSDRRSLRQLTGEAPAPASAAAAAEATSPVTDMHGTGSMYRTASGRAKAKAHAYGQHDHQRHVPRTQFAPQGAQAAQGAANAPGLPPVHLTAAQVQHFQFATAHNTWNKGANL